MKKHVLIFCHGTNSPFVDVCNQYAAVFDRTQYEVSVAYLVGDIQEEVKQKTLADQVYFLEQPKRGVRGLKFAALLSMLKLCREKQFSIIICHRFKPLYIIALISLLIKIPKLFAVMHATGTLKRRSRQLFTYLFVKNRMTLACVSDAVRQDMLQDAKHLKASEIAVLPNVININYFEQQLISTADARKKLGLPSDGFIFGNTGRLVTNKGQLELIQAFAEINKHNPNTYLVIMGKGYLAPSLQQLAQQLGIANKVILTGFVVDAFRYMKAFDVLVSASKDEAFGRVFLEAMVAKVPIIATSVGGVPEVIGDAGILVPLKQPTALANAMLTALAMDPLTRQQLGEAGYSRVKKHFSLAVFRAQFLQLCE